MKEIETVLGSLLVILFFGWLAAAYVNVLRLKPVRIDSRRRKRG